MSKWLSQHSIDTEYMVQNGIKYHDLHIEFLFVKNLQTSDYVVSEDFSVLWNVVLAQIISEENGAI